MSSEQNLTIRNKIEMLLFGKQELSNEAQPVAITEDRELMIAVRMLGSVARTPVPTDGAVLDGTLTDYFTATRISEITLELTNSLNLEGATVRVVLKIDPSGTERDILPSQTVVPVGVGIRVGPYLLNPGGAIAASCDPPSTVTILPIPYRIG